MRFINVHQTLSTLAALAALSAGCTKNAPIAAEPPSAKPAATSPAASAPDCRTQGAGRYATVNGLKMYYEVHGKGRPLVLLHGALTTIESSFGKVLPALSCTRQVIAIEQQAHGRTADINRPLSYTQMADDTAALLRQIGIQQADFYGYSMGGATALQVAVRHPALVRKLVLVSAGYNNDGMQPELAAFMSSIDPNNAPWAGALKAEFQSVAPHPEQWPAPLVRVKELVATNKGLRPEDIRGVKAQTLVVTGDRDAMTLEHTISLYRLLPKAELAVFPGTDHFPGMVNRSEWTLATVPAFLDAPIAEAK